MRMLNGQTESADSFSMLLWIMIFCFFSIANGEGKQYFIVRPVNSSVQEGHDVMIPCIVGNQAGMVQWVKDGFAYVVEANGAVAGHQRLRLVGDRNAGVYNLTISNASLTDDGEYQCQVGPYGRFKAIRANAHLDVISPPQKVEISSHPNKAKIEVNVGEALHLECAVRYAKPEAKIVWFRGNVQIKGGDTKVTPISIEDDKEVQKPGESRKKLLKYDTHGSISIIPTEDDDETDYTCDARHPAIKIDRPMRATVKLSVFYPPGAPYIQGYTEGESIQRGQLVELVCRSRGGNPPAQIIWFRNEELLSTVYRTENRLSESILSFLAEADDDKARYRCQVSNIMSVSPMNVHVDLAVLFSPVDVKITGPTEAKANEEVTIVCTTEKSNPAANIKWTVNSLDFTNSTQTLKTAPNSGWITSSNVTFPIRQDLRSVVVTCNAVNDKIGTTVTGTHIVTVIYPPAELTIAGYESEKSVMAGSVLKLTCTARAGNPPANLTWYKNNKEVLGTTKVRDQVVTNELEIQVNASDNNARVTCEAVNSATDKPMIREFVLRVNFPPSHVKITRDPKEFRAGQIGRIICESGSSNPAARMSWSKDGMVLEGTTNSTKVGAHGGFISTVELTLDLSENMNGDVYTCEAKNVGMDRASLDALTLNVLYKPIFATMDPNELIGMEGEPYTISISASANPDEIHYTWTRDGLPLSNNSKKITARNSTLNITKLNRNDAGTYICEAKNKEGTTFYQLNLTVQYAAEIKRTSTSGEVYPANSEAKLFCEIDGSPIGDEYVTWYKVGSNSALSDRYSTSFANKTSYLHIENPGQEDVGEYRCNVNNGIGNVTSDPILFITNFEPIMISTPLTKKAAANKGNNVKLYCKARGSPLPKFTWTYNSKTLLPNGSPSKYDIVYSTVSELESQSSLTIRDVTSKDYGKYSCKAKNEMGSGNDEIYLNVTSPPDQPIDLEVYNVTHDSVTLIWKRGFDGGLPTSHLIRWRQALDYEKRYYYMDINPGDYSARITGLKLGTYYVFSIQAVNAKGESPFLPDLVKVQTLREAPPTELTASEINSSYVIVIIIAVSACACLLIATPIVYATLKSKKKAQRSGPNTEVNLPDVLLEKGDFPMNYIYTVAATSVVFFIINLFILLWYIVRKRNKARINKSQTADMYAPSTVNGDTMTGELSSVSDEKSDVNFDANDYVDEGRKTAASTYLIDQSMQEFGKSSLEMQVHHQGTLGRRSNHVPGILSMDSPPQRTTASGTLSVSKSSYIGNPSPAPPTDVNFYSVEMDSGRYMGYEGNPSPAPALGDPGPGAYYPSLVGAGLHGGQHQTTGTGTLTRNRTLPRPVPPPDVTVMTAGTKSPIPPSVPPPPVTFARAAHNPVHSHGHQLSTFTPTPTYSDIDGHLV